MTADVPEARKELLHAIYERIVVAGPRFVQVKLTTAAYDHGLALALLRRLSSAGDLRRGIPRMAGRAP